MAKVKKVTRATEDTLLTPRLHTVKPIVLCHGLLVEVAGNEVGQQRHGGPHSKKTLWTEESIGTASGLWLQTGTDGVLLLPIVLTRTGGSEC